MMKLNMRINRDIGFKVFIYLITISIVSMVLMFLLMFFSVSIFFYLKNGWPIDIGLEDLLQALKKGVPIGLILGVGTWFMHRFNIR